MRWGKETVLELDVSNASGLIVQSCLELLWKVKEEKKKYGRRYSLWGTAKRSDEMPHDH